MRRGEVWRADLPPPAGRRPVLIITRDSAIMVRDALTVAPITRTLWHIPVEVTLDARDGMPTACVVNCDNLLTIPKSLLQSHICTLTTGKVEQAIIVDFRITDTLSMYNQPPKSPLSGGLRKLRSGRSYW